MAALRLHCALGQHWSTASDFLQSGQQLTPSEDLESEGLLPGLSDSGDFDAAPDFPDAAAARSASAAGIGGSEGTDAPAITGESAPGSIIDSSDGTYGAATPEAAACADLRCSASAAGTGGSEGTETPAMTGESVAGSIMGSSVGT
jgi:hypothetical protein